KKNEWINKDLITDVLVLKKPPKRNKAVFSNKEIDKIYDALSKNESDQKFMHYTIFSVLYQFGIRVSSLVRLKVSNIEFDNNRVRYFDCKSKTWAYGYPPDEGIMVLLKDYIDMQGLSDSDTYLFRDSDANPISSSNVRDIIYHYYNKAGIQEKYKHNNQNKNKYNVHTLRFYFITSLCKAGVPETTVQKVIHHKNINNTGIYNIFQENDIRKGIKDSLYTGISQPYATESEVS
ncbi:MAG: tyrosine-type recombinase/integrase, partial [Candidatus Woesearchaeota archaeon]